MSPHLFQIRHASVEDALGMSHQLAAQQRDPSPPLLTPGLVRFSYGGMLAVHAVMPTLTPSRCRMSRSRAWPVSFAVLVRLSLVSGCSAMACHLLAHAGCAWDQCALLQLCMQRCIALQLIALRGSGSVHQTHACDGLQGTFLCQHCRLMSSVPTRPWLPSLIPSPRTYARSHPR